MDDRTAPDDQNPNASTFPDVHTFGVRGVYRREPGVAHAKPCFTPGYFLPGLWPEETGTQPRDDTRVVDRWPQAARQSPIALIQCSADTFVWV